VERGLLNANILLIKGKGILRIRTSALFGAKNFRFFKIYGMSARIGGGGDLSQCGQGRGVNFSRFCADVFYGGPLILQLILKLVNR